jgi:hypothetical protein
MTRDTRTLAEIRLRGERLLIRIGVYSNGRPALTIVDEFGFPFTVLTINLPDEDLAPGDIFVKIWGENAAFIGELLSTGFFFDTGKRVKTGFVEAAIWTTTFSLDRVCSNCGTPERFGRLVPCLECPRLLCPPCRKALNGKCGL